MPFKTTPEIDFSAVGLITDVPTHSLPDGAWNDCLNLRCKDGSVQGVNIFEDDVVLHDTDPVIIGGKLMAVTQFTPSGYDYLIVAYIVRGTDNFGYVVTYNSDSGAYNNITNVLADLRFTFHDRYPPQIFVFNELLIVNPAVDAPPMFTDTGISSGSLNILPSWPEDATYSTATPPVLIDTSPLITRSLKPFGNRLMAMNIFEEHQSGIGDDVNLPVDILWSSHITGIGALTNVEWTASTTNTAGDAFAVETPGKILDGGQLGELFIAYKSDSVIRVSETGDTYVLSFESIFEDDGIYSSRCFSNIGNAQHLVVGNYGVYIHDGQSQKTDIAKGIFQDTIFSLVKTGGCTVDLGNLYDSSDDYATCAASSGTWTESERDRSFCFQQTRDKEVWFCFSSESNTGEGCDLAFVYDYGEQKLHKRTLPDLVDVYEAEINGTLRVYAASPSNPKIQLLSNSRYEPNGFFTHEDDNLSDNTVIKWINGIYLDSVNNVRVGLDATQHLTDSKTYPMQTFNPTNSYKLDTRTTGRYMNIKVQMDGDKNPQLGKIQFDVKLAGKR